MPEPQSFCCLPWCGKSFSGPTHARSFRVGTKIRVVDGKTVTVDVLKRYVYPSMIDMHDIVPRSQGGDPLDLDNNLPWCHDCHMAHHSGSEIIEIRGNAEDGFEVRKASGSWHKVRLSDGMEGA